MTNRGKPKIDNRPKMSDQYGIFIKDRPIGREQFWCYRFNPIDSRHDTTKTRRGPLHPSRDSLTGTHPRD